MGRLQSADISWNDDGTLSVSARPREKRDKKGNTVWEEPIKLTAPSLSEAISKIEGLNKKEAASSVDALREYIQGPAPQEEKQEETA